jgi:membrane-associated phospholipid phosphatase
VHVGLKSGAEVFSATSRLANPVAAVPSLHTAYPVLIFLFFWSSVGRRRWLLALYPLAMSFTLIYTAEHFVFDVVLGWLYAIAVYFVGSAIYADFFEPTTRRRSARTHARHRWRRTPKSTGAITAPEQPT